MSQGRRPEGTITRGTTAPNRLRRVDRWIARVHGPLLRRHDRPLVVDLGYGASPVTTAELFTRLRAVHPRVEVAGIEIDPERVAAARTFEREGLSFRLGGFELPAERPPTLIRAFNVLRQYDEAEAWAAWDRLCAGLAPDGVLVEGTCDEIGRRAVWVTLRRAHGSSRGRAGTAGGT
ncbi:MAG: class I SAM-dependent methyltransferase, partial [Actinoallomurus sp.]